MFPLDKILEYIDIDDKVRILKNDLKDFGIDAKFKNSPATGNTCLVLKDSEKDYFEKFKEKFEIIKSPFNKPLSNETDIRYANGIVALFVIRKNDKLKNYFNREIDYFGRIEMYNDLTLLDVDSLINFIQNGTKVAYENKVYTVVNNSIENTNEDMSNLNYYLSDINNGLDYCKVAIYSDVKKIENPNYGKYTGDVLDIENIENNKHSSNKVVRIAKNILNSMLDNIGIKTDNIVYTDDYENYYKYAVNLSLDNFDNEHIGLANFIDGAKGVYADYMNDSDYIIIY